MMGPEGSVDPVVQPNRDTIAAIRKVCGNPIYTELDGHGHDSWRSIYPMPEFIAWMFAQRRGVPWPQVSAAPTAAQILAAEQAPVKGLNAGQSEVALPMNCPPASAGGAGGAGAANAGGTPNASGEAGSGLPGEPGAGGGGDPSSAAAAGAGASGGGGLPSAAGSAAASGSSSSATASGSAGVSGKAPPESDAGEPANGCSCSVIGRNAAPRSPLSLLTVLAAVAALGARRRRLFG